MEQQKPTNEVITALMNQLKMSMSDIKGIDDFSETAGRVVAGELAVDDAVPRMMSFFTGEVGGDSEARARLVTLARAIRERNGLVPIVLLSFSTCRDVLRS